MEPTIGRKVAATTKAYLISPAGGYQYGRYHTTSRVRESSRSHGMGVATRLVKRNTKAAPNSSPRLLPPTITCDHAELPKYLLAMAGAIAFSRYRWP
jgi:hypothetical protein